MMPIAIVILLAAAGFCGWFKPLLGEPFFRRWELRAKALARNPLRASASLAMTVLLVRAALLPLLPIPQPAVGDELSYVFAADTFAHGRLANPVHPLWPFFETAHVLVRPTYSTKYFPGQGLFLVAGQILMGHPWFGVWLSCGLMAGAVTWAAFGWLPPAWALFAGSLVLPASIFSYWMNSYWGGSVAALGGALVTGAAGRLLSGRFTSGAGCAAIFAAGSVLLCLTRPLEGVILLTVLFVNLPWKIVRRLAGTAWIVFFSIASCGAAWLGYYNFRVTGSPLRIPEVEYQRQYGSAPLLIFLPFGPSKEVRDPHLRLNLDVWERDLVLQARTLRGQVLRGRAVAEAAILFAGFHWLFLAPLTLFSIWVARDRRVRIPLLLLCWGAAGGLTEIAYFSHYAAPFCAALVIVASQGFRHLRVWSIGSRPVGRFLFRAIVALGLAMVALREGRDWITKDNYGDPFAFAPAPGRRASLEDSLPSGRRHVIVVRYEEPYQLHSHWVYNHADVDGSRVVWARDLGPEENKRLRAYYPDRQFWLLRPNQDPAWLEPYR